MSIKTWLGCCGQGRKDVLRMEPRALHIVGALCILALPLNYTPGPHAHISHCSSLVFPKKVVKEGKTKSRQYLLVKIKENPFSSKDDDASS